MQRCNGVTLLLGYALLVVAGVTHVPSVAQGQQFGVSGVRGLRQYSRVGPEIRPQPPAAAAAPVGPRPLRGDTFTYNPAAAAVTELARSIGSILGRQNKAAVFSPVSIACALSLMLLGADHETKSELVRVLNFDGFANNLDVIHRLYSDMLRELAVKEFDRIPPRWRTANPCYDDDEDDPEEAAAAAASFPLQPDIIRVTNAVFVRDGIQLHGSFLHYSKNYYNSVAKNVPFATNPAKAAAFINQWALRSTEGKIRDILSESVAAEAEMIVASALYFKGLWSEPFEPHSTELKPFYLDGYQGGETKLVPSMATIGCYPYYDAQEYNAKIVGLSYQSNKTALYIIIPNNSTRQVMQQFQRGLTPAMIGDMVSKMTQRKMFLQVPRMHITNTINLRDVLQQLGLRTIFNRAQSDLSGMIYRPPSTPTPTGEQFGTRLGAPLDSSSFVFPVEEDTKPTDTRRGTSPNGGPVPPQRNPPPPPVNVTREISAGDQLHVSEFIHRVELEINEKGTEGGAITTSTIFRALPSIHMRIDAPFLILIGHDETRLPLFYGTIYDPTP